MHACMYVCMHACTHTQTFGADGLRDPRIFSFEATNTRTERHSPRSLRVYLYICISVYLYLCISLSLCVYTHTHKYTHTHTHTHTHTRTDTHTRTNTHTHTHTHLADEVLHLDMEHQVAVDKTLLHAHLDRLRLVQMRSTGEHRGARRGGQHTECER